MQTPRRIALTALGLIAIAASASAPPATDIAADEAVPRGPPVAAGLFD